jgi:hypothetical protein
MMLDDTGLIMYPRPKQTVLQSLDRKGCRNNDSTLPMSLMKLIFSQFTSNSRMLTSAHEMASIGNVDLNLQMCRGGQLLYQRTLCDQ